MTHPFFYRAKYSNGGGIFGPPREQGVTYTSPEPFQKRLNVAYRAANMTPPTIYAGDMQAQGDKYAADLQAIASNHALEALHCKTPKDWQALMDESLAAVTRAKSWEALRPLLGQDQIGCAVQAEYLANLDAYCADIAPAVNATIDAIIDAATSLPGVPDPLDTENVAQSGFDARHVITLQEEIEKLGHFAVLRGFPKPVNHAYRHDALSRALSFIEIDEPGESLMADRDKQIIEPTDPVVKGIRDVVTSLVRHDAKANKSLAWDALPYRWRPFTVDHMIVFIARGDVSGMRLSYATDAATVNTRRERLEAATSPVMSPEARGKRKPVVLL